MAGDYYGGDDEGPMAKPKMGGPDKADKSEEDEGEALLPKSFFGGDVKPGHRCMVEVTHVGEDQCVVKYVDEGKESPAPSEMERAGNEMTSMATEG